MNRSLVSVLRVVLRFIGWASGTTADDPAPFNPDGEADTIGLPADAEREIRELLWDGRKVEAVKRVRQLTGAGLREAKDYVDGLARGMGV
ncbi:MAG: 50S ribosomal protein L7/L12 [Anaerolineales bacterium]|nr:50S ribosomal protein L7/L12 [Anaerolineales bacterium]